MAQRTAVLLLLALRLSLGAQSGGPPSPVILTGSIRSRIENWDWFTASRGDHAYTYDGTTIRVGVTQSRPRFDWALELEAPILLNLPSDAVAPGAQGQLGQGATYFVSNDNRSNVISLFPKQAFVRWKSDNTARQTLVLGRFDFQDGEEGASKDPAIAGIRRERIQQRLVGPFGFTHVMRSFDGFHYAYNLPTFNVTLVGATPTRGVFQVDGWGWMNVAFAYASVTGTVQTPSTNGEWRLFAIYYDDWRRVTKTDNRSAAVRSGESSGITLGTFGAHYVNVVRTPAGSIDVLGEAAVQTGSWGALMQRSNMFDVEAGFQPNVTRLRPRISAGYYRGSGDSDPNDRIHGTFFQVLPTARPFAPFPFYNMMNTAEQFATAVVHPTPRLTLKAEAHQLRLSNPNDLWYTGGGAFQPSTFGYQGRSGAGATSLGDLFGASLEFAVTPQLSVAQFYGRATGRDVIRAIYPDGPRGHLAFVELTYRR